MKILTSPTGFQTNTLRAAQVGAGYVCHLHNMSPGCENDNWN